MEFFRKLFGAKPRAAPEEDKPGQPIPPSPQRVAGRALVLAALRFRAEFESDPDAEEHAKAEADFAKAKELGYEPQ
jgi:hypothetical protein